MKFLRMCYPIVENDRRPCRILLDTFSASHGTYNAKSEIGRKLTKIKKDIAKHSHRFKTFQNVPNVPNVPTCAKHSKRPKCTKQLIVWIARILTVFGRNRLRRPDLFLQKFSWRRKRFRVVVVVIVVDARTLLRTW